MAMSREAKERVLLKLDALEHKHIEGMLNFYDFYNFFKEVIDEIFEEEEESGEGNS